MGAKTGVFDTRFDRSFKFTAQAVSRNGVSTNGINNSILHFLKKMGVVLPRKKKCAA